LRHGAHGLTGKASGYPEYVRLLQTIHTPSTPGTQMRLRIVRRWLSLLALAASVLLIFGAPVLLLGRAVASKTPFDSETVVALRESKPDYVFIGNSMLDSRIDTEYLGALTGGTVVNLWDGGGKSAIWYLRLKNQVIASGIDPNRLFVFFRDRSLTEPMERSDGRYGELIERYSLTSEPEFESIMAQNATAWERVTHPIVSVYDPGNRREQAEALVGKLSASAMNPRMALAAVGVLTGQDGSRERYGAELDEYNDLRNRTNSAFGPETRRASSESETDSTGGADFDSSVDSSFLPLMLRDANDAGIALVFVRVKRRSEADGLLPRDRALVDYMADLEAYVKTHGGGYVDMSSEPSITTQLYLNGDHIDPKHKRAYTELFHSLNRAHFDASRQRQGID
jgi:hypothetical protein